jgi:hypothetical protein
MKWVMLFVGKKMTAIRAENYTKLVNKNILCGQYAHLLNFKADSESGN